MDTVVHVCNTHPEIILVAESTVRTMISRRKSRSILKTINTSEYVG